MALIDIALAATNVVYVDTTIAHDATSLANLGVASADTVVYYGGGSIDLTSILGVNALANANVIATGGSTVTIDAGLLDVSLLTSTNLLIDGDSKITLEAGAVSVASSLTTIFNKTTIAFSGSGDGNFTYVPPAIGLLSNVNIKIDEMRPGDEIVVPFPGGGLGALREDKGVLNLENAYRSGYLYLKNGDPLLNQVHVKIKMTTAEHAAYLANKGDWLIGSQDKFIFPGDDGDDPVYEVVVCFTIGTLIATPDGARAIEDLLPGDLVLTRDNGPQPLRWIGLRRLDAIDLRLHANLRPVRVRAGALGKNVPEVDLVVSPQHRILVRSRIAERMFGQPEALVAAKHLLQLDGVELEEDPVDVTYVHILFDQHEIVTANGAPAESLYLGPVALEAVGEAALTEIRMIFPELLEEGFDPAAARLLVSGRQGRQLASRHFRNCQPLYDVARQN